MKNTTESTYNVTGSVRGTIGKNLTLGKAVKLATKDSRACARLSSPGSLTRTYSDVRVVRADGTSLTDSEREQIFSLGQE